MAQEVDAKSTLIPPPFSVLGVDTGNVVSGYVLIHVPLSGRMSVVEGGVVPNEELLRLLRVVPADAAGVEKIAYMGTPRMGISDSVFDSSELVGKVCLRMEDRDIPVYRLKRKTIFTCLTGKAKSSDKIVSDTLKSRFGQPGTKKDPGRLYGVKSHIWSALAVAVVCTESYLGTPLM
jgi:Holliday junction resolvasome RuvABC endonuclease subunit